MSLSGIDEKLTPILGEFAWHSLTVDPTIAEVSAAHLNVIEELLNTHPPQSPTLHILEVAAYAHTTGYELQQRLRSSVELFDISPSTLRLGEQLAGEQGIRVKGTKRTAGDFHELPYEDSQFDLVYICSALHHTWRWQQVLSEMMRVLNPGGILFLENEPCRRAFCFNRFRTNRVESFTGFERKLEELEIVRVIAEAYLGSRPETLFGMVENQSIPLDEMLEAVEAHCSVLEITVQPEICMGPLERELVQRHISDSKEIRNWLTSALTERIDDAAVALTNIERGLGFSLPSTEEIQSLSRRTAEQVEHLPPSDTLDFRKALSNLFGASVRIAARKKGRRASNSGGEFMQHHPEAGGVTIAFPPEIARLLSPGACIVPDLQTADLATLNQTFPESEWTMEVATHDIRNLVPSVPAPRILVSVPEPGRLVLLFRMYVSFKGQPYDVVLSTDQGDPTSFPVYQNDSHLLTKTMTCRGKDELVLTLCAEALAATEVPVESFRINYMGAFVLRS
jgi:SAM-dependent methyltransferase